MLMRMRMLDVCYMPSVMATMAFNAAVAILSRQHSFLSASFFSMHSSYALADIVRLKQEGHDVRAAVASRTDEPEWAFDCMEHLVVQLHDDKDNAGLVTLLDCFGGHRKKNPLIQISFQDKTHHFKRLHAATKVPYEDMVFFDNENWNIRSVSKLGVKCIYTPDGMKKRHWDEAKKYFGMMD
jgi:magnesium-dependent phosphatase-1